MDLSQRSLRKVALAQKKRRRRGRIYSVSTQASCSTSACSSLPSEAASSSSALSSSKWPCHQVTLNSKSSATAKMTPAIPLTILYLSYCAPFQTRRVQPGAPCAVWTAFSSDSSTTLSVQQTLPDGFIWTREGDESIEIDGLSIPALSHRSCCSSC